MIFAAIKLTYRMLTDFFHKIFCVYVHTCASPLTQPSKDEDKRETVERCYILLLKKQTNKQNQIKNTPLRCWCCQCGRLRVSQRFWKGEAGIALKITKTSVVFGVISHWTVNAAESSLKLLTKKVNCPKNSLLWSTLNMYWHSRELLQSTACAPLWELSFQAAHVLAHGNQTM